MSNEEELYDAEIFTLTDEDGNETDFALLATAEIEGVTYMALEPAEDNDEGEYVILKIAHDDETDEDILVTIDDDDEFDRVADLFEDEFMTMDYDEDHASDTANDADANNETPAQNRFAFLSLLFKGSREKRCLTPIQLVSSCIANPLPFLKNTHSFEWVFLIFLFSNDP